MLKSFSFWRVLTFTNVLRDVFEMANVSVTLVWKLRSDLTCSYIYQRFTWRFRNGKRKCDAKCCRSFRVWKLRSDLTRSYIYQRFTRRFRNGKRKCDAGCCRSFHVWKLRSDLTCSVIYQRFLPSFRTIFEEITNKESKFIVLIFHIWWRGERKK